MENLSRDLQTVRSRICDTFLVVLAIVSMPALGASLYRAVDIGWQQPLMTIHVGLAAVLWTIALFRKHIPYGFRAGYLVAGFFVMGVSGAWQFGMVATGGATAAIATPTLATVFFGRRFGAVTLVVVLLLGVGLAVSTVSGTRLPNFDLNEYATMPSAWAAQLAGVTLVGGALYAAIALFGDFLIGAMREARRHRDELAAHQAELENLVDQRTLELQHEKAALEEKSRALTVSNADLESFARAVSHDLKSPLAGIAGFAELLQRRYRGRLDDRADAHLEAIVTDAHRMAGLIEGLLHHAQVSARSIPPLPTDLNEVLEQALANLRAETMRTAARIDREPLPAINADPSQMICLFQNLLDNAIKYRVEGHSPEVHVACENGGDAWLFSVRDNGIGITAEDRTRIFEIFERGEKVTGRGSTVDRTGGSGIGLATCRRIVEGHGGRIWVEPAPDGGSIFRFTLPKAMRISDEAAE